MRYIRVRWLRSSPAEPAELYSEIDDAGRETRKVELFADGTAGFAGAGEAAGSTELGESPIPPLVTIASDPQFKPEEIGKEEFEKLWTKRFSLLRSAS
jgi:hypothetical protein